MSNNIGQSKVAALEDLYFQWCSLNANKTDIVTYFSNIIYQFLLVCFRICFKNFKQNGQVFVEV